MVSVVLIPIQFPEEPAGRRADPYAIDVAHIEFNSGCAKRVVLDEDAMDGCLDGFFSIPIDDVGYGLVEMRVLMVLTWIPCSLAYEFADVFDRRVSGIFGPFSSVV